MSTFDEAKIKRQTAGTSKGGQFAAKPNSAPGVALASEADQPMIGADPQPISAAEARRLLPVGTQTRVVYLDGRDRPSDLRTVEKQSAHQMITKREGDDGRGVYMDWAGMKASVDSAGSVIISKEGMPFVAFAPADSDQLEVHTPWQVTDTLAAKDPEATPEKLIELSHNGVLATARRVGQHPNSPDEALRNLVGGEERDGSPRTPVHQDEDLAVNIIGHPHVSADTIARTREVMEGNERVDYAAARSERASRAMLTALSAHTSAQVRLTVGHNPNTALNDLQRLAKDPASAVRDAVASNPGVDPDTLDGLAKGTGFARAAVAANPSASAETLKRLSADTSTGNQTRAMAARNPSLPAHLRRAAVKDQDAWVRQHAAKNPNLTVVESVALSRDGDSKVRRALAGNPRASKEALQQLAYDPDAFVRSATAKNENTSTEQLAQMAGDDFHAVRAGVAGNARTPLSVLSKLKDDEATNVKLIAEQALSNRRR